MTPLVGDTAESWFLARGLPAVLTLRGRSRHLLSRIAPALAGYATVVVALLAAYFLLGSGEIYIDGAPTPAEQVVLAVLVFVLPVAVVVGWLVVRPRDHHRGNLFRARSHRAQPAGAGQVDRWRFE